MLLCYVLLICPDLVRGEGGGLAALVGGVELRAVDQGSLVVALAGGVLGWVALPVALLQDLLLLLADRPACRYPWCLATVERVVA